MKHLLVILCLFSLSSFAQDSSDKEAYFKTLLAKEPNSEEVNFDYAHHLYKKEDLDQAQVYVARVLKLNPAHARAQRLKAHIDVLKPVTDPKARKKMMFDYLMMEMKVASENLKKIHADIDNKLAPGSMDKYTEQNQLDKQKLDEKYNISKSSESCHPYVKPIYDLEALASQYKRKGMNEEALKLYRNGINKLENPKFRASIINLLVKMKNFSIAQDEVTKALTLYPQDVRFQIQNDGITKINAVKSSEMQESLMTELSDNMMLAETILFEVCNKSK